MDLFSYTLGKKAGGGGGDTPDLSEYFITKITHNTGSSNYTNIVKKSAPITLSEDVTSLYNCFYQLNVEKLDLSQIDTSKVTSMNGMFSYSQVQGIIGLKNFNTEQVENYTGMFFNCSKIKILDCSSFVIKQNNKVKTQNMFNSCYGITKLDISNMNVNDIYSFGNMFTSCGSNCLQSEGAYADGIPYVYVKDTTAQNWVLTANNGHPSTWTTANVVVKGSE